MKVSEKGSILLFTLIGVLILGVVVVLVLLNFGIFTKNQPQLESSFLLAPTGEQTFSNAEKLKQAAKKTDTLIIKNCQLKPQVAAVIRGKTLKIKNQDNSERIINLPGLENSLAPGEVIELESNKFDLPLQLIATASQKPQQVILPVSCDNSEKLAGYIVVED